MSNFDAIEYDEVSQQTYETIAKYFKQLENIIYGELIDGRCKSLVLTKLEEAHMWCNKSIRDAQLHRENTKMFSSESTTYGR